MKSNQSKGIKLSLSSTRRDSFLIAILVMILAVIVMQILRHQYQETVYAEARSQILSEIIPYGNALSAVIDQRLVLMKGLEAFTKVNLTELDRTDFSEFTPFADVLYNSSSDLRAIIIAPEGIARYVYPMQGNEPITNLDMLHDSRNPSVAADVARAIQTRQVVLSQPFELLQGGTGIVLHQAIFQGDQLWGLINLLIDYPTILKDAGMVHPPPGIGFDLRDQAGNISLGSPVVFDQQPVTYTISIPGGSWTLAAIPQTGWQGAILSPMRTFDLIGYTMILLLGLLVYQFTNHRVRLSMDVLDRTQALNQELESHRQTEEALRQSESTLRQILETLPVGVWVADKTGKLISGNRAGQQIWGGVRLVEMDQLGEYEGWWADSKEKVKPEDWALVRAIQEGISSQEEMINIRCFDGSYKTIYNSAVPLRGINDQIIGAVAVNQDITELRQANQVLLLLSQIQQALNHYKNESELLDEVCKIAVETGQFRMAWIGMALDDVDHTIQPVAWAGYEAGYLQNTRITWDNGIHGQGPVGISIRTHQPFISQNIATDPIMVPWSNEAVKRGYASATSLPLTANDRVLGCLVLYAGETELFQPEIIQYLQEIANDLAIGITALRAVTEQKQAEEAQRKSEALLHIVLEQMPVGVWFADALGTLQSANPAGLAIWGAPMYLRKEEYGQFKAWWPDTGDPIQPDEWALSKAITYGTTTLNEIISIEAVDGKRKTILNSVVPVKSDAGEVVGAVVVNQDITEIEQAKRAIQESEERFRSVFEQAAVGISLVAPDGHFLRVNKKLSLMTGYSPDELLRMTFQEITCPDDLDLELGYIDRALTGQISAYSLEKRYYCKSGEIIWVSLTVSLIRDWTGQPEHFVSVNEDITRRKWVEQEISNLAKFPAENPEPVLRVSEDGRLLYVNPAGRDLLDHWQTSIGKPVPVEWQTRIREALASGKRKIVEIEAFEKIYTIAITPILGAGYANLYGSDITILRQASDALKISEERYRTLAANLPNGSVFLYDRDLRYLLVDGTDLAEIGLSRQMLEGKTIFEALDSETAQTIYPHYQAVFQGQTVTFEMAYVGRDYRVIINPVVGAEGKIVAGLVMTQNVTEQKHAEKAIREMNEELERRVQERTAQLTAANKELEAFSYSVSHDLRTPLRGIDGFSQVLLEDYRAGLPPEGQKYLERIRAASQRMGSLIDDLLRLSRLTRADMKPRPENLSQLFETISVEYQHNNPERQVQVTIQPGLIAMADPQLIRIALDNLFGNAWKFTSPKNPAEISFGALQAEDRPTAYFVKDNGIGFDMAYANKLFGAFQRLHSIDEFPGNGIGLATVQRVIHRHGGEVWAEGVPGEGATFYFTLPD